MSKSGWVAIIGRPNVGKSTLLNQILGTELSIVTPKPQTTRNKIRGILTESQGQIVFVDTPGIHRAKKNGFNEWMVEQAESAISSNEVTWYLVDPTSAISHEEIILDRLRQVKTRLFLIANKLDLVKKHQIEKKLESFLGHLSSYAQKNGFSLDPIFKISAHTQEGVAELMRATWKHLPEGPLFFEDEDQISDRPVRFFVGEFIREQLFLQLGEEIPYSCAVETTCFNEKVKPTRIEATILVERESQKGMVIGHGGSKIKSIGQKAREKTESFLGEKIFLGLKVKVLKDWTKNKEKLKRLYD